MSSIMSYCRPTWSTHARRPWRGTRPSTHTMSRTIARCSMLFKKWRPTGFLNCNQQHLLHRNQCCLPLRSLWHRTLAPRRLVHPQSIHSKHIMPFNTVIYPVNMSFQHPGNRWINRWRWSSQHSRVTEPDHSDPWRRRRRWRRSWR